MSERVAVRPSRKPASPTWNVDDRMPWRMPVVPGAQHAALRPGFLLSHPGGRMVRGLEGDLQAPTLRFGT